MPNSTMTLSTWRLTTSNSSMSSWFELLHVSWRRRVRHRPSYTQKNSAVLHRLEQGKSFSFGPPGQRASAGTISGVYVGSAAVVRACGRLSRVPCGSVCSALVMMTPELRVSENDSRSDLAPTNHEISRQVSGLLLADVVTGPGATRTTQIEDSTWVHANREKIHAPRGL